MKIKRILILISTIGLFLCFGIIGHADTSTADVNWDNVTKTQVGYYAMHNVAMTTDSSGVNLYIDSGNTNQSLPTTDYTLTANNRPYYITLTRNGSQVTATAINSNWQKLGTVGSGSLMTVGTVETLILHLSFAQLGITTASGDVTLSCSGLGSQTVSSSIITNPATSILDGSGVTSDPEPIDDSSKDASNSSSSNKTDDLSTSGNNQSGNLGITIDGNFDDWADKTKHPMKITGDDDNIKYASLLTDHDNIYFYILMSPKLSGGYTNFQPSGYQLEVGGKTFYLSFNNNQTVNLDVNQKQSVSLNIYSDSANTNLLGHAYVARQYLDQKMGDGSTVQGSSYVLECAVPYASLTGISDTSGQTITLANPNLWSGTIEASGGSTGPIVLASAGFVIAIAGAIKLSGFKFKRRRR
ncbi:Firmicu-CTERM sorting domain-containing protein [Levilactobacillus sp. N40-8-2]|uniref:Firmicu-CTERM sorting domain-containing protein n=1 Tax=Levilactobacillus muriae TaxID=3238987 RepID=UPI0038B2F324